MPTSAPGSNARADARRAARGFTLIELMVVLAIVAIGAGLVSLAIRDPAGNRLELDATRLASLLESARTEARAGGFAAAWVPSEEPQRDPFAFVGLPPELNYPTRWLDAGVRARVDGAPYLVLGPDAILPPQRVVLTLEDRRLEVASDGLGPFAVVAASAPQP